MAQRKSEVTIYHNPACTTSRKVLGMIKDLMDWRWCPKDERGMTEPTWGPEFF